MSRKSIKADEQFMLQIIEEKYLKKNFPDYYVTHDIDPPDFFVQTEGKQIALEMSRLYSQTEVKDINNETHSTYTDSSIFSEPILYFIESLNKHSTILEIPYSISVNVKYPLKDYKNFKKKLLKDLCNALADSPSERKGTIILGNDSINYTARRLPVAPGHIGGIVYGHPAFNANIESNIVFALIKKIREKSVKLKKIGPDLCSEKWLCVYDMYPLSSDELYPRVKAHEIEENDFSKVFIINAKHEIVVLEF